MPGFMQSGKVFAEKSSGIRKILTKKQNLQLDYLDPPTIIPKKEDLPFSLGNEEEAEEKWKSVVDRNMNRCWWIARGPGDYEGFPTAFQYVLDYVKENGPYDGIIGFSQGAAMASIVLNELLKTQDMKIALFISGFVFTQPINLEVEMSDLDHLIKDITDYTTKVEIKPAFQRYFTVPDPLSCKVISVYGSEDVAVPAIRSKYLLTLYPSLTEFEHDGGHLVPNKKQFLSPIVEIFRETFEEKSNL